MQSINRCVLYWICRDIRIVVYFSVGQSGVDDPNFTYDLLTELTRTFLAYADDVRAQDSAAYALQVYTRVNIDTLYKSSCFD